MYIACDFRPSSCLDELICSRGQLLFSGLYTRFQVIFFRDFKDFGLDFRDFRDSEDFRALNYFNGFKLDFKEFKSDVRDFSDLQSDFMDFGPDFRDLRSDFEGFRPYSRDFTTGFKGVLRRISTFSSRISEIFG